MLRVLLLLPTATYRAPDFTRAAAHLGVDVVVGSEAPQAMIEAVAAVVHKNMKPKQAFELFRSLKAASESEPARVRSVS